MPYSSLPILAIEVTSQQASIAWSQGDESGSIDFNNSRYIETELSGHIKSALAQLSEAPSIILVGLGPGSYSGCRVAIASAICLGLWHDCPVIGLPSTLATLANQAEVATLIGNARRGEYFIWPLIYGTPQHEPQFHSQAELENHLQLTKTPIYSLDSSNAFIKLTPEPLIPRALPLIKYWLTLKPAQQKQLIEQAAQTPLEPCYLRSAQITPAKK